MSIILIQLSSSQLKTPLLSQCITLFVAVNLRGLCEIASFKDSWIEGYLNDYQGVPLHLPFKEKCRILWFMGMCALL